LTLFCKLIVPLPLGALTKTAVVVKGTRLIAISPNRTLAYQLAVSAVVLPVLSVLAGEPGIVRLDAVVIGSVLYQALVVAFASYLAWFWLMRHYPAPQLSAFTFFAPLFGVAGGALVLGEPVGVGLIVGAIFVGTGIWLVNRPRR
jgi:drug/metabolite transporter (DMT)-like permease